MVEPAPGAVITVPFPFSDLSSTRVRPAVCLAESGRGDWILCQVTSQPYGDLKAVTLSEADFRAGRLHVESFARPGKLFTASRQLMVGSVGSLKRESLERIVDAVIALLKPAPGR